MYVNSFHSEYKPRMSFRSTGNIDQNFNIRASQICHFGSVFPHFQKRCFCEDIRTLVNSTVLTREVGKFMFVLERVYIHKK